MNWRPLPPPGTDGPDTSPTRRASRVFDDVGPKTTRGAGSVASSSTAKIEMPVGQAKLSTHEVFAWAGCASAPTTVEASSAEINACAPRRARGWVFIDGIPFGREE